MACVSAVRLLLNSQHIPLQHLVGFAHLGRRVAAKGVVRPNAICPRTMANSYPTVA
jgi:hypothetical protein